MKKRYLYILIIFAFPYAGIAQIYSKLFSENSSVFLFNFNNEPAQIERNKSDFTNNFGSSSASYFFYHKKTGELSGKIEGYHEDGSKGIIYSYYNLITPLTDTLKIIPDNFYKYAYSSIYYKYKVTPLFVIPDKYSDTAYHFVFYLDSGVKIKDTFYYSMAFYRVDFSISKYGAKLLTPYPTYIGAINDVGRMNINDFILFKNYSVKLKNSNDGFYLYTLRKDSQEVYFSDLTIVKLKQTTAYTLYTDSLMFSQFGESNYSIYPQYFSQSPHIGFALFNYYPDSPLFRKDFAKVLLLDSTSHLIKKLVDIETNTFYQKNDTTSAGFNTLFSPNGRYLYKLDRKLIKHSSINLSIKKFDLYNTTINSVAKKYTLFDSLIQTPDTVASLYDIKYYYLHHGPCNRIFSYIHNYNTFLVNKPDMPFGFEKSYRNFPVVLKPDTSIYNKNSLFVAVNANQYPIKYNPKLNTIEEFHCHSLELYVDADTIYKNFVWYVWNNSTQKFDSTVGISCYINSLDIGVYYKLKGTTVDGYSAWYSDSVYAQSPPAANFYTLPEKHCQYTKILFNDSSYAHKYSPVIPTSWHWLFGDGTDTFIYSNTPPSSVGFGSVEHIYNKSGNFNVTLIFYNGLCEDTFILSQPVYIAPAPQSGFDITPNNGCVPQIFHIKPTHKDSIVSEKYKVYTSLNKLIDSFSNTPSFPEYPLGFSLNQKDSGSIVIKQILVGTSGCITQDSVSIQLNTRPYLKLLNDTFICSEEVMQLSAIAGPYKYLWNTGDTTKDIIINKAGNYWVKETNGACNVYDTATITQNFDDLCKFNISVYPNPVSTEFNIRVYSRIAQDINIQLYEISGKQVASYNNIPVNKFATLAINTSELAEAMYILHITTNDRKFTYKIIKLTE